LGKRPGDGIKATGVHGSSRGTRVAIDSIGVFHNRHYCACNQRCQ
jgi:hypothetical protein